jgi:hypothetical protein
VNTDAPGLLLPSFTAAECRVLENQAKLHRWATGDPQYRFDDLFNLVADPAFLVGAWDRVRGNKGSRTAGVDGKTARYIEAEQGVEVFLGQLRQQLKLRSFQPVPVRERMIPKVGGKLRRLGIPTTGQEGAQGRHGQGQDDVPTEHQPPAGVSAASAQPGAAGLGHLLPARGVQLDLPIPVQVRLGTGDGMDPAQTPKDHLEGTAPTLLRRRLVAD